MSLADGGVLLHGESCKGIFLCFVLGGRRGFYYSLCCAGVYFFVLGGRAVIYYSLFGLNPLIFCPTRTDILLLLDESCK